MEEPKFEGKQEKKDNKDIFIKEMWTECPMEGKVAIAEVLAGYAETGFATIVFDDNSDLWVKEGQHVVPDGVNYKSRVVFKWKGDSWEKIAGEEK